MTLRLVCIVRICIPTAEHAKAGCIAGSVAGGYTMHVRVCAWRVYVRDLRQLASHSIVRGPTLASTFYKIIKWVSF